jgi:putative nucleotidyltransferase with HDIG domain
MTEKVKTERQLINDLVHLRQQIAAIRATEIKRKSSVEAPQEHFDTFPALCDTVINLNSQLDIGELMEIVITCVAGLVNAKHGYCCLYDPDADVLVLKKALGFFYDHIGYQVKQGVGVMGTVFQTGKPIIVNDYQSWEERHPDSRWNPIRALIAMPLTFDGQVRGQIGLVHTGTGKKFGDDDMAVLARFAALATTVLTNGTLYAQTQQARAECKLVEEELQRSNEQLQETFIATINALATAVEMRDPYTAAHQRWVTQLACVIASEMDLANEQIEGLRMAGLVHDIGKMNVPTEFLVKPGQLTEIEYEAIKVHPQSGYDIVRQIPFPWPVAQLVLQHHERMDGSGYPQGISNTEILLEARILAVADVVEAMASHRPYRDAHGVEISLEEISRNRGVLYDPEVVDACLKVFKEKAFTFE